MSAVAVTSDAGSDETYAKDDVVEVTVTVSEAVEVTGSPRLKIDMDPAEWGEKWAAYHSGSGTTSLTFIHTVVEPNKSTQGIAVLENTLELNGGTIQSAATDTDADLTHAGLAHDANHKVDWQQSAPPANSPATGAPTITGTARVGETLTADTGGISDDDGLDNASFSYQWLADDADITGATGNTYTLAGADQGKAVRVRVSFTDDGGHGERLTSAATAAVEAAQPPEVTGVAVVSNPGDDATYGLNDVIRITLTFSEAVEVSGAPRLKIDMDPAEWGEKWAGYESGSGTASLVFAHTVVEPNISTQGIAVLADTLELNDGTIRSASAQTDAVLSHTGLAHDGSHQVDWRQSEPNLAPVVNVQAVNYALFTGQQNAPRGTLVSKPFYQVFTDPDGDELTYSASVRDDQRQLVAELTVTLHEDLRERHQNEPWWRWDDGELDLVFFQADADADWKALRPALADPLVVTVTLTATDPGGLSASVDGDFLIDWASHPELVRAVASKQAIELTYDQAVQATPAPASSQFTVNVVKGDDSEETIAVNGVSVNGSVVTLELASELEEGQTVTLDYAHDAETPLRAADGWGAPAPSFRGQAVDMSRLGLPGPVANLAVNTEPGQLDLLARWDEVAGATSYKLRWRQSGEEFQAANAIAVTGGAMGVVTVSGYGQWEVRAQGCNDDGCGPEASSTVDLVPAASLRLARPLDSEGQVRPRTITATWDAVADAASYTLRWWPANENPPAQPAVARQARSVGVRGASSQTGNQLTVPAGRTNAEFTVPDGRAYQAELQARGDGDEVIAQGGAGVDQMSGEPDTTPPTIQWGEINGNHMTVYFSEPLDEDYVGGTFRGYTSISGWPGLSVARSSNIKVSGNAVTVDFEGPLWLTVGLNAYTEYFIDPAGRTLRDLAGNLVSTPHPREPWSLHKARTHTWIIRLNNITPPSLLQGVAAYPHWLALTFSEALDERSVPAASAFTVTVNGSPVNLADYRSVVVGGNTVRLVLAAPVSSTDVLTVSYAKPSSGGRLRGASNEIATFSGQTVTNRVGEEPAVKRVAITSTPADGEAYAPGETVQVSLTFTEAVTVAGAPRLRIGMPEHRIEEWADYASGNGTTTLVFAYTVAAWDRSNQGVAVLRNSLDLNGGSIGSVSTPRKDARLWYEDLGPDASHKMDWRRSTPGVPWVTGVAITSDPGNSGAYSPGDTIQVTVTYDQAVNVVTTGGTPGLKIRLAPDVRRVATDDEERWANYASGSGTAKLVFAYPVAAGNYSVYGVAVLGNTLALNGGAIRSTAMPPVNAHLRHEGLYHDPDHRVDTSGPSLEGVAVSGTKVSVAFDEALDTTSVPPASAFTVKRTSQGSVEETVSLSGAPVIAGGAVLLTLASAVVATDTGVKVSYSKPTGVGVNKLTDAAGNEAASFTDWATDAADTTPPKPVRGEIDGGNVTIYFSEPLDEIYETYGIPHSEEDHFRIFLEVADNLGNAPIFGVCAGEFGGRGFRAQPEKVIISGNMVTLVNIGYGIGIERLRALVGRQYNRFNYHRYFNNNDKVLRDLAGNAASGAIIFLDNVTHLPSPERATVVGSRLTLTSSAPMKVGSVPPASAFTVKVNGGAVSLAGANPVAVSGWDVTLTLAAAVASGDTVTVSYEKPDSNWLENVVCEYAPSFTDQAVTNSTP